MLQIEIRRPDELNPAERAAWRAFRQTQPGLASPYFSLGFLDAMGSVRRDVRVLVARRRGVIAGFLPVHAGLMGHARPLGGPLGDHHGLIAEPGVRLDLNELISGAGLGVLDFHGALADQPAFRTCADETFGSWVVDLAAGFEAFRTERKRLGGNTFRNIDAAMRKLERAGRSVEFILDDRDPETCAQGLAWKSAQFRASRHFDVFSVDWTRNLMRELIHVGHADCRGLVSSLRIDGELAAVHIGMRSQSVLHYWFPAYDPALAKSAPGNALLMEMCRALPGEGVEQVHLGPGDYRYKAALGSWQFPLAEGFAAAPAPAGWLRRAAHWCETTAEALPIGRLSRWPGKAFRRIDRYAAFRAA